jgi:hypothetical protein
MDVAKKEGKTKKENLAEVKSKKQRIRKEMPPYGYIVFTAVRNPSLAIGRVTRNNE